MDHKKTIINTMARKDHENIKSKMFMFNCFGYILECDGRISLYEFDGQLSDIELKCLYPIHPVNGILLVRSSYCAGDEGYCCDFGGF